MTDLKTLKRIVEDAKEIVIAAQHAHDDALTHLEEKQAELYKARRDYNEAYEEEHRR